MDENIRETNHPIKEIIDTWGLIHNKTTEVLEKEFGKKKITAVLQNEMKRLGRENADIEAVDASAIGNRIMQFEQYWGICGSVRKQSDDCFIREVTECPWSYFSPFACRILGWYMAGFCEGMNSGYYYNLNKLIPEGDNSCEWQISQKT